MSLLETVALNGCRSSLERLSTCIHTDAMGMKDVEVH